MPRGQNIWKGHAAESKQISIEGGRDYRGCRTLGHGPGVVEDCRRWCSWLLIEALAGYIVPMMHFERAWENLRQGEHLEVLIGVSQSG